MRTFRDISIDRKLIVIIMVTTVAAMLLSGIGIFISDAILFRGYMRRDLTALASIVADNATAALVFDDPDSAEETLGSLRERSHIMKACIYRTDGTELARYGRAGSSAGCPPAMPRADIHFTSTDVTVWRPVMLDGRPIGTLALFYDLGELYERGQLYGVIVLGVPLAASLLSLLLSSRLRAIVTTPVSNLARVAARVSSTRDYNIRAEKQSGDELGILVDSFNEMLSAIQFRDDELLKAILDREQALKQAGSARDSLKTTLASIGDAVISTDLNGRVFFANRVARALLKTTEPDLAGKCLEEVFVTVSESNRQRMESPVREVLREDRIAGTFNHAVLISSDGTETPIDFSGAPIRSDDGAMHGTVLVFRDARARRKAEETSRLLAAIVESSDDGIIGQDLTGVITSWNRGAERMFGYSAEEMIGSHGSVLTAPGQIDDIPEILTRITRGESLNQIRTVRRTRSGAVIDVWITVSPLRDAAGRITGLSKIARDITQQVRATNRLASLNTDLKRSNDSLARSNEDLERFAFVASHDLQEPLRMIAIFTQLLLRTCPVPSEQPAIYASHIVDGIQRMRELLADLLAYTEIGATADIPVEPVDLNIVVDKVRENLSAAIAESGAIIAAEALPVLNVSESDFISLFQNLIGNAIKYRSQRHPEIRITMDRKEGQLTFTVADNGIGIEPQYHERIFVAFKRLHGKKIPGTGIGLAICQRVAERYGGCIRVKSELDHGAAFIITLPEILTSGGNG
ncbi:MAG: PAS domain S-box protein [Acidobacteriota bacterium]